MSDHIYTSNNIYQFRHYGKFNKIRRGKPAFVGHFEPIDTIHLPENKQCTCLHFNKKKKTIILQQLYVY